MSPSRRPARRPATHRTARIGLPTASALYIAAVLGTGILVLPGLAADAAGPGLGRRGRRRAAALDPARRAPSRRSPRAIPDAGGVATFVRLALGDTAARAWPATGSSSASDSARPSSRRSAASTSSPRSAPTARSCPYIGIGFLALPLALNFFGLRVAGSVQLVLTGAARRGRRRRRRVAGPGGRAVELRAVPAARLGRGRRRDQPVRVGVRRLGGGHPHRRRVHEPAAHHPARHGDRDRGRRASPTSPCSSSPSACSATGGRAARCRSSTSSRSPLPGVGPIVVAVIAVVVAVGVLNAYLPAFANLGASLGRDGDLPRWFAKGAEPGRGAAPRARRSSPCSSLVYFGRCSSRSASTSRRSSSSTRARMVAIYAIGMVAAVRLLERWTPRLVDGASISRRAHRRPARARRRQPARPRSCSPSPRSR